MKFEIVSNDLRSEVSTTTRKRSPWVQALMDGKTLKIPKEDRKKIGGNVATLRNHGLRLRSGLITETDVLVWAEPIKEVK